MRLYTYKIHTRIGYFERIAAELDGKLIDLNLACATYFTEKGEPNAYEYASFLIPPNMVSR